MAGTLELGLDTFGDITNDANGDKLSYAQVIRNVIEQGALADEVGVDFIGVGEHHRADFAISAPETVLAAIASRTQRIRLGSAVTVLSSDEPVRVFERFATVDAASGGRAEIILGRGSFTESFPLFGYDLSQYEELFNEKLDLFSHLLREDAVTWQGRLRAPLTNQQVYPKTGSGHIKTWIGVGGSPESVVRAVRYEMPMMLAIIGGNPARFLPFIDLYKRAAGELETPPLPLGMHSPGHIADTDELAREQLWPHYRESLDRIGAERGWGPTTLGGYESEIASGSLYVGSPETVARKIAASIRTLGVERFDMKYATGPMPHEQLMHSIELYGGTVIPMVRDLLA
jgi:probable LLM family oxidoreductase